MPGRIWTRFWKLGFVRALFWQLGAKVGVVLKCVPKNLEILCPEMALFEKRFLEQFSLLEVASSAKWTLPFSVLGSILVSLLIISLLAPVRAESSGRMVANNASALKGGFT